MCVCVCVGACVGGWAGVSVCLSKSCSKCLINLIIAFNLKLNFISYYFETAPFNPK